MCVEFAASRRIVYGCWDGDRELGVAQTHCLVTRNLVVKRPLRRGRIARSTITLSV